MTIFGKPSDSARIFAPQDKSASRRKQALRLAFLEHLEERTLLSSVDITSETLVYNGGNAASSVTVSVTGSDTLEKFSDSAAIITLSSAAISAGWTGSGTHTVIGPINSFSGMAITTSSALGQSLTLDFSGGDPLHNSGLLYTPAAATDPALNILTIQGSAFTSEAYTATGQGSGTITYTNAAHSNVPITFSNLTPINDTTPASSFTFNAVSTASTINIINGGVVAGANTYQINDGGTGQFELINFANKGIVTINANNANTTINVAPSVAAAGLTTLNINSVSSGETVNLIRTSSGVVTSVNVGPALDNIINIGNGGFLSSILGAIDLSGSGTINVNDSNDFTHATVTLDNASGNVVFPFEVTGLSTGLISYASGFSALNINSGTSGTLGASGVTFNINNTGAGTTTLNGAGNQNFFNLSNPGESGGMDNLAAIVVHGGGSFSDVVTLNDASADFNDGYTITGTTVTRDVFGGLTYDDNIGSLILNAENTLGTNGNNTITVNGTADFVNTTINGQGGIDTINLNSTGSFGTVTVNTGSTAGSTINILACNSPVTVTMNAATTVNIGSTGGSGDMTGIQAAVSLLNLPSSFALNFHDENDTTAQSWTLNDDDGANTGNIGLSSGSPISYRPTDVSSLTLNGGSGGNTFNVNQTTLFAATTLNTGTGSDTTTVLATANNTLNINGQDNADTITLGGLANIGMQNLHGTISIQNTISQTTLVLDDSEDATGRTTALVSDSANGNFTGISPATIAYRDADINTFHILGGSGNDIYNVNGNRRALFINDTAGNNTLNVDAQALTPSVATGSSANEVVVHLPLLVNDPTNGSVDVTGCANVNFTNVAPITITPGTPQTVTSVVHTGFINSTVADFTVNLPAIGTNPSGLSIGGFSSSIAWGDGTPNSAGTVTQDPNNHNHYLITGSHIFNAIGAFTDSNTASFTPPVNSTYSATLNGITVSLPLNTINSTAGTNGTAISTTPNTSVFSPGPAAIATAGKLLKKIAIQLKTPQNKLDKLDNSSVTISIASGPGNFANGSITTVNAVKGKATFSHLQLNIAGTYTIHILNGEKTITSQTFTVAASKVASLTISSPPVSPNTTTALSFTVHAFDAFGNLVAKAPIKLAIASGPTSAKIIGTVSQNTPANGTATFSNLFLHTAGPYTLKATSKSILITTSLFDVT